MDRPEMEREREREGLAGMAQALTGIKGCRP